MSILYDVFNLLKSEGSASAAITAVAIVLGELYRILSSTINEKKANQATEEQKFLRAIDSVELKIVGAYLRDNIGSIPIDVYATDRRARERITKHVQALARFLEIDEQRGETDVVRASTSRPAQAEASPPTVASVDPRLVAEIERFPAVEQALRELRSGEVWNALARLRRDLEILLRQRLGVSPSTRMALGEAARLNEFPADVREHLAAFAFVANRAVHGHEVSGLEAAAALEHALVVYDFIERQSAPSPDSHL